MKKQISHQNQDYTIDVHQEGANISIQLNGKNYTFVKHATATGWLLKNGAKVFHGHQVFAHNDDHQIKVNGIDIQIQYKDPYALGSSSTDGANQGDVKAVMPGRVVKIQVKQGQEVKQGQSVLVLEAMKMENEIKASRDGIIEKILVAENDSVESGTLMMIIQPLPQPAT